MTTNEIMRLADDYAQLSVDLECENLEHGTAGAESITWVDESRAALLAAVEAYRASVIDECAKVCKQLDPYNISKGRDTHFVDCADAIRSLK